MHSPLRPDDRPVWAELAPGTKIEVVKLDPGGDEVTRYPGVVLPSPKAGEWLAVEARWIRPEIALDGLRFVPGDTLREYFSSTHPFDAFAIYSPENTLRGWYANVTWPSWIDLADTPVLYWHDLYVDLIALPSGEVVVRDEDELEASDIDLEIRNMILAARDELLRRFTTREIPFHDR